MTSGSSTLPSILSDTAWKHSSVLQNLTSESLLASFLNAGPWMTSDNAQKSLHDACLFLGRKLVPGVTNQACMFPPPFVITMTFENFSHACVFVFFENNHIFKNLFLLITTTKHIFGERVWFYIEQINIQKFLVLDLQSSVHGH